MWSSNPPSATAEQLALGAIFKIKDANLAKRIKSSIPEISTNSASLKKSVQCAVTWQVESSDFPLSLVSSTEMRGLYDRMRDYSGARKYYDDIKSNATLDYCPYCNSGYATTVDHFLPKEDYPTLSIDPWNLVPSCNDCNQTLGRLVATSEAESPFHPYGDTVPADDRWLYASIKEASPPGVEYIASPPAHWPPKLADRVRHNFDKFKLNLMYQSRSGETLSLAQIYAARQYEGMTTTNAEASVRNFLTDSAILLEETHNNMNHWKAVLFRTLASNDWFCTTRW